MERHEPAGGLPGASDPSDREVPRQEAPKPELPTPEVGTPDVPGYDVVRFLGRGGSGDVWLVRDHSTGGLAAAKICRPAADGGDAVDPLLAARRELRVLRASSHPHLVAYRDAVPCGGSGDGEIALVIEYAAGGSLARLVAVRDRLTVGETVTTIGPIAQALAALHADGTAHHDVSPANVLFSAQGRPLLSDFGTARMVGDAGGSREGTQGFEDPAAPAPGADDAMRREADVYGLGAVAWFCLTGQPPPRTAERPPLTLLAEDVPAELAVAIDAALAEEPRSRPTAAEFARAVFRSARPEPVDLAPAVGAEVLPELVTRLQPDARRRIFGRGGPRGRRLPGADMFRRGTGAAGRVGGSGARAPRRRGVLPRRGTLGFALATAVVLGAGGLWWASAALLDGSTTTSVGADARGEAPAWSQLPHSLRERAASADPVQAVQALAEIRALAISASNRDLLDRVNAPGSEAAAADVVLVDRLAVEGQRLEGFTARVVEATLESPAPGVEGVSGSTAAVVRARVVSSGFAVVGADGVERTAPGAGRDQTLRIVVERGAGAWRVARILPA